MLRATGARWVGQIAMRPPHRLDEVQTAGFADRGRRRRLLGYRARARGARCGTHGRARSDRVVTTGRACAIRSGRERDQHACRPGNEGRPRGRAGTAAPRDLVRIPGGQARGARPARRQGANDRHVPARGDRGRAAAAHRLRCHRGHRCQGVVARDRRRPVRPAPGRARTGANPGAPPTTTSSGTPSVTPGPVPFLRASSRASRPGTCTSSIRPGSRFTGTRSSSHGWRRRCTDGEGSRGAARWVGSGSSRWRVVDTEYQQGPVLEAEGL